MTVRDWLNYKGEGPWSFTPQPDKWGYLNNPRWTSAPGPRVSYTGNEDTEPQVWVPYEPSGVPTGSKEHLPCGHWHKRKPDEDPSSIVNIFGVYAGTISTPDIVCGAVFNYTTENLTYHGYYQSNNDIPLQALHFGQGTNELMLIEDTDADVKILLVDYTLTSSGSIEYQIASRYSTLSQYDITANAGATIIVNETNYFIYSTSHRIIKLNKSYQEVATGYSGNCGYSPEDGALYVLTYIPIFGNPYNSPPDEGSNTYWLYIPDQQTDSPILPWPATTGITARGLVNNLFLYKDDTYGEHLVIGSVASPYDEFKRLDVNTFENLDYKRTARNGMSLTMSPPYAFNVQRGLSGWFLYQMDYDELTETGEGINAEGDPNDAKFSVVYEDYLIQCTSFGIYVTDVATMNSYTADHRDEGGWTEIIPLTNRYFAVAGTNKLGVYYLNTDGSIRLADMLYLSDHGPVGGEIKMASLISTLQKGVVTYGY